MYVKYCSGSPNTEHTCFGTNKNNLRLQIYVNQIERDAAASSELTPNPTPPFPTIIIVTFIITIN